MRLTIKINDEYITDDTKCMKNKYINKLGQLEDIEEKLNCGLLKLEEVSKTWKIYSTWLKDYMKVINIVIWEEATRPYMTCIYKDHNGKTKEKIIFIDQYLETWALTKEELL